jgi:hypothetical protein
MEPGVSLLPRKSLCLRVFARHGLSTTNQGDTNEEGEGPTNLVAPLEESIGKVKENR